MKRETKTLNLPSGATVTIWPASMLVMGECAQAANPFDSARIMIARCTGDLIFKENNREQRFSVECKAPDKCGANEISVDELEAEDQALLAQEIQDISTLLNGAEGEAADADNKSEAEADAPSAPGDAD